MSRLPFLHRFWISVVSEFLDKTIFFGEISPTKKSSHLAISNTKLPDFSALFNNTKTTKMNKKKTSLNQLIGFHSLIAVWPPRSCVQFPWSSALTSLEVNNGENPWSIWSWWFPGAFLVNDTWKHTECVHAKLEECIEISESSAKTNWDGATPKRWQIKHHLVGGLTTHFKNIGQIWSFP